MINPISKITEELANDRSKWIDYTIQSHIPEWKKKIILKYKSKVVAWLLGVFIEIENYTLIANFGTQIIIKMNSRIIGERKFSY